jgi:molybdopterin-binding protein
MPYPECVVVLTDSEPLCYFSGMTLSARNRLEGKVTEMESGGVMTHVVVRVGKNVVESVITKRSAQEMKLKVGDAVTVVIKSTEVMLEKK